jgi:hypothetical protein
VGILPRLHYGMSFSFFFFFFFSPPLLEGFEVAVAGLGGVWVDSPIHGSRIGITHTPTLYT